MIYLKKAYRLLFLLGLFFFPFNSFQGIAFLGEFKNEAGAFFFLLGFFCLLLSGKISLPLKNKTYQLMMLFFLWCIITTVLNYPTIYYNYYKHTTGTQRFIRQFISLSFSVLLFFTFFWNVLKVMSIQEILLKTRRIFLFSLLFASFYSFFEILIVIFGITALMPIIKLFDYLPFMGVTINVDRISSFSYEPPSFGIYLITVAGWMFSYILTEKSLYRFIPSFLILILTYFSGSRTALATVFIQFSVFLYILFKTSQHKTFIKKFLSSVALLGIVLLIFNGSNFITSVSKKLDSLNFSDNLTKNISNQSRFGIQYSSLCVFAENPIIGVGFGQQSFQGRYHYPGWATRDNWEFTKIYKNPNEKSFPPGYNIFTRLLAETGIIGTAIFLFLIFYCIYKSKKMTTSSSDLERVLSLILLTSFIGTAMNWMQIDSFRIYGFWLCLVILIRLANEKRTRSVTN